MVVEVPVLLGKGQYDVGEVGSFTMINACHVDDSVISCHISAERIGDLFRLHPLQQ